MYLGNMATSFKPFSFTSVHLASFAAILCYCITLWNEYEDSVRTHCHTWNLLPSFSSAIGDYTPQRYIWRLCVGVSCTLRLFSVLVFAENLRRYNRSGPIVQILTFMRVAEILGLFLLTMFASTEIFPAHAFGFCMYFLFSTLNIAIGSRFMSSGVTGSGKLNTDTDWYPAVYVLTFVGCFISYMIHNNYCMPGVYTIFGGLELVMIFSNIMFWYHCDCLEWTSYTISIE